MKAWKDDSSFFNNIVSDKKITNKISVNKLKNLFDFGYHIKKIDIIFNRNIEKSNHMNKGKNYTKVKLKLSMKLKIMI